MSAFRTGQPVIVANPLPEHRCYENRKGVIGETSQGLRVNWVHVEFGPDEHVNFHRLELEPARKRKTGGAG